MDWKQILSLSFDELTDLKRDELYELLVELRRETLDKKHFKRLIDLQQHILRYKGDMVNTLLTELETISSKDLQQINTEVLLTEIAQLKDIIAKLDADKAKLKVRLTELSDENAFLQRRTHDSSTPGADQPVAGSDRDDSPDVLSELDRHEELLATISAKNRHIKRLLRDIDGMEAQSGVQLGQIGQLKDSLADAVENLGRVDGQLAEHRRRMAEQTEIIEALRLNVRNLEDQTVAMERERDERESQIQEFGARLEERAMRWRELLQEKDDRLDSLRTKYELVLESNPDAAIDADWVELQRMQAAIGQRDEVIADLEQKVAELSREMCDTTDMMNRLAKEREGKGSVDGGRRRRCSGCEEQRGRMERAVDRAKELQELMDEAAGESAAKGKQAQEAMEALRAYTSGEDGLQQALQRIAELQAKVLSRDGKCAALVKEINALQQLGQENCVLRSRLGIADDAVVDTTKLAAKQRRLEKLNERLTLKLRASEEMRLQLKLDMNDLKRRQTANGAAQGGEDLIIYCRHCENPRSTTDVYICTKCTAEQQPEKEPTEMRELSERYEIVVEENENLRLGMHEILQQLRNYDAESQHIVIDTPTLERLLHALDARSVSGWYHPAMRMQNELIAVKEREQALKERVRVSESQHVAESGVTSDAHIPTISEPSSEIQQEKNTGDTTHYSFDALLQRLMDQETELATAQSKLDASEQRQRSLELSCEQLKGVEQEYHDLTEMLANGEDEQAVAITQQSKELVALRNEFIAAQLKRQYADEDLQQSRAQSRAVVDRLIGVLYEVRRELATEKSKPPRKLTETGSRQIAQRDQEDLRREVQRLKCKLGALSSNALRDLAKLDAQQLPIDLEKINRIGVIQEDCVLNFITKSELDTLHMEKIRLADRNSDLESNTRHLESLLQLSQDQVATHQKQLNDQFEDETALRHLIVDLQSENQEKYIIAKMGKDLKKAQDAVEELRSGNERFITEVDRLRDRLAEEVDRVQRLDTEHLAAQTDCELKLRFLSKSFAVMRENFQIFTPLYPLVEFIQHYSLVLEAHKENAINARNEQLRISDEKVQILCDEVRKSSGTNFDDKIEIIKYQNQIAYLKQQSEQDARSIGDLHTELNTIKLREADWSQHWDTIKMLFAVEDTSPKDKKLSHDVQTSAIQVLHKETQSLVKTNDQSVNTEAGRFSARANSGNDSPDNSDHGTFIVDDNDDDNDADEVVSIVEAPPLPAPRRHIHTRPIATSTRVPGHPGPLDTADISLASQLKQAMALASARSALLLDAENQLTTAQTRIKALERSLQERDRSLLELREAASRQSSPRRPDDNILSVTIASLQGLLCEKDTTMARYQELLRGERDNRSAAYEEHRKEVRELQLRIDELMAQLRARDRELDAVKAQKTAERESARETRKPTALDGQRRRVSFEAASIPDAAIEDMFLGDYGDEEAGETNRQADDKIVPDYRRRIADLEEETRTLHAKLREVSKRESGWERTLCEKDKQIAALNDRIGQDQLNIEEISHSISTRRDIDQLRELLDEKDRHIGDLTETLTHFHDDQQKFMNDTSIHSAEQVSQLSADLSRSEATQRILTTQLDATKRQLTAIAQRETQAREVIKTLKTQLIRRPVISVKTTASERPSISREEQLQKRIHLLESDLQNTKDELRKQSTAAQCRRSKDAAELALWNKQKRSQQLAEQLRQRLGERDAELEKVRGHLAAAKTAIARLEREKHILESRRPASGPKYCQSPSCPNIHVTATPSAALAATTVAKYTPAESPDSYNAMLEYAQQQPPLSAESQPSSTRSRQTGVVLDISDGNQEVIDALRARIESQQRRIVSMELEGRGGTALGGELERMQEKVANVEALNMRLESRNLQLQLETDVLRKGDQAERTRRQIKHLEDYILALKSELSQAQINAADAHRPISSASSGHPGASQQQHMEQTILSLRRIVERLKIENKQLRDGKPFASGSAQSAAGSNNKPQATIAKEMYEKMRVDLERVQQSYSEALDRISALQIELDIQRGVCAHCKVLLEKRSGAASDAESASSQANLSTSDDCAALKEKLIKKSQLLEKAKILLARAAAKEKQFREQIVFWKRRCAELQNVPVIEETSE